MRHSVEDIGGLTRAEQQAGDAAEGADKAWLHGVYELTFMKQRCFASSNRLRTLQ